MTPALTVAAGWPYGGGGGLGRGSLISRLFLEAANAGKMHPLFLEMQVPHPAQTCPAGQPFVPLSCSVLIIKVTAAHYTLVRKRENILKNKIKITHNHTQQR